MQQDLQQLAGFVLVGIVPWFGGYIIQRSGAEWSVIIRPPQWIVWICGNPRGDGQLDLGGGGMQLTALIPLIGGPLSILLGIDTRLRVAILISTYLFTVIVWIVAVEWINRRHPVEGSFVVKRAQHYTRPRLLEGVEEILFTILKLKGDRAVILLDFTAWEEFSEGTREAALEGLFKIVLVFLERYREVKVEFRETIPREVEQRLAQARQSELGYKLTWEAIQAGE